VRWRPAATRPRRRSPLERLRAAAADPTLAEPRLEFNTSGAILAIATEVLTGHIAASTKDFEAAVERLRAGAKLEDALTDGEPPDWSVPVGQELGIVLLRAERPAEAEQAFREDLKRFPENGWSLLQRSVSCPDTDFSSLNKPDVEPRRGAQSATSPHGASRRSPVSIP
jgi:hypothetical protein